MNKLKQFIEELGRMPIVPLAGFPGIELTGKSIKACLSNADIQTETLLALYEQIKPDALFTMMDLTVEAEFLGCSLKFSEDDPPAVQESALEDEERVEELFEKKTIGGRMPLFAEVVRGLRHALDIPVCAYVIGPFTLAGQIMDLARVMKATRKNPTKLHHLLSKSTELIMNYVALLEDSGADLICVLEPSAMMISARHFKEFSGQYCGKLFREGISRMSVLHICGDTNHLISEMEETGPDGLSLDKQVSMPEVYHRLNNGTVLIGNIDPVSILALGTPGLVRKESEELKKAMEGKRNFILSTGCDVPQNASLDNIRAMISVKDI